MAGFAEKWLAVSCVFSKEKFNKIFVRRVMARIGLFGKSERIVHEAMKEPNV